MINVTMNFQIFLLALGGTMCFFMGLFACIVEYRSRRRKRAILLIEFSTSFLLLTDMAMYMYLGNTSDTGILIEKITNFLLYLFIYVELFGFNMFIGTFMDKNNRVIVRETRIVNGMTFLGVTLLVASQYTGWFYYMDQNNNYVRGPLFPLSYVAPFVVLVLMFFTILKYKKELPPLILIASLIYVILPPVSAIFQAFIYGISFFNFSVGISAITVFALSLMDQNVYLKIVASTDKMLGIPNAYGYIVQLGKLCEKKEISKYDAFYFDIVRMGMINRKYGNHVGDYVIQSYAQTICQQYLSKGEILGRLGGNYFVALTKRENTKAFIDMLQGVKIDLNEVGINHSIKVAAVAGVYQIEQNQITPDEILANVSMAVNIAKNMKKKSYVFLTKELMQEMNEQRQLMEMIPSCMEKGEFVPFYQPKVNLMNHSLSGAEALCRWKHEGEMVLPGKFIPLLEQNETICNMDFYLLERVCEDICRWMDAGYHVPVISVNFSRKNLGNRRLAEQIYQIILNHHIPLSAIQIEITETIDDYPFERLKKVVEELQAKGIAVAIDDFGVGSSSVRVVKDIPFDVLKIDKSFVESLTEKDCRFLYHIIEMAGEIGAGIVAEGVETKEQIEVLKGLGCQEVQGYFFDRPLDKETFEQRLRMPCYTKMEQ